MHTLDSVFPASVEYRSRMGGTSVVHLASLTKTDRHNTAKGLVVPSINVVS